MSNNKSKPAATSAPTPAPTSEATSAPAVVEQGATSEATLEPTTLPTEAPVVTEAPTQAPTEEPTQAPSAEPTSAPTEAPVVTEAPTEQPTSAPVEDEVITPTIVTVEIIAKTSDLQGRIEDIVNNGTMLARTTITALEQYMANMKPGVPTDIQTGTQNQMALWRALQNLINNAEDDFGPIFGIVLELFAEHNETGVFGERYVHRFDENLPLAAHERQAFRNLLALMTLTALADDRKQALKQTSVDRVLGNFWSEDSRNRLIGFYGL